MEPTIIPDVVNDQTIHSLGETNSVLDAARLMQRHDISAIVVIKEIGGLAGIVTERDITRKVVAEELQASSTELRDIMTPDPASVAPGDSPLHALQVMQFFNIRHLLIIHEGQLVGIVSMRDLRANLAAMSL